MEFVQILETVDNCQGLGSIVKVVKGVLDIIRLVIPILLILLGTIDLGKAVISSDDKEVKASQGRLIKRVIYAVAIFFVATLVTLIMNIVAGATASDNTASSVPNWGDCWSNPDGGDKVNE